MACGHTNTRKINDLKVCLDCGLTVTQDGRIFFDREIVNYRPKRRKGGKKNGKK